MTLHLQLHNKRTRTRTPPMMLWSTPVFHRFSAVSMSYVHGAHIFDVKRVCICVLCARVQVATYVCHQANSAEQTEAKFPRSSLFASWTVPILYVARDCLSCFSLPIISRMLSRSIDLFCSLISGCVCVFHCATRSATSVSIFCIAHVVLVYVWIVVHHLI